MKLLLNIARFFNKKSKNIRNLIKRSAIVNGNIQIHKSVGISWSAKIDPARGAITIGANSSIDHGAILRAYGGKIKIGENCTINPYCILYGGGGLLIGNGVRIAAQTIIVPSNHIFDDPDEYIYKQGEKKIGITIEDDVWIGAGARILDGVIIKKGCVVAAGSVVTKSTSPYSIIAGVPAREIGSRLHRSEKH